MCTLLTAAATHLLIANRLRFKVTIAAGLAAVQSMPSGSKPGRTAAAFAACVLLKILDRHHGLVCLDAREERGRP